jgi:hypothetical protein
MLPSTADLWLKLATTCFLAPCNWLLQQGSDSFRVFSNSFDFAGWQNKR